MFATKISVTLAVGFILFVCGIASERKSAYNVAFKCTKAAWDADTSALQSAQGVKDEDDIIEAACKFEREFACCIKNTNPGDYASSVPNIVHFLVALHWQHMFIAKKAGLCKDLHIDKLKKIAVESGIMAKENLPNVEGDSYKKCAGDSVRKCMIRLESHMKQRISQDALIASKDYVNCYEEAVKSCDATILYHFFVLIKAYQKHLEENEGKFGKMIDNIKLPSQ